MPAKPAFEEYAQTVADALGSKEDLRGAERAFRFNMRMAHSTVISGTVLAGLIKAFKEMPPVYAAGRPELLFSPPEFPDELRLLQKPFQSTLHKLYRHNVLYNRNYPKPPRNGWIEPAKLYEEVDDLLRTRIICKYMDGPKFVCTHLTTHCRSEGIESHFRELSTEAGYYAWHFYFRAPIELMEGNVVSERRIWVEIQFSTQLAEVITSLTHGLYEARRAGQAQAGSDEEWRWDANSQHFRSAYLGHGLHLLEGVIQTFKDDMLKNKPASPSDVSGKKHDEKEE